jgi:hypothetical protein
LRQIARREKEGSMNLRKRMLERQQRKAHRRYLLERARQQALQGQDPQRAIRDVARRSGGAQQGMYGQN